MYERLIMDQWDRDSLIEKEGGREEYLLDRIDRLEEEIGNLEEKLEESLNETKEAKAELIEFKQKLRDLIEEE